MGGGLVMARFERIYKDITDVAEHSEIIAKSMLERELTTKSEKKTFYFWLRGNSDKHIRENPFYTWVIDTIELYTKNS